MAAGGRGAPEPVVADHDGDRWAPALADRSDLDGGRRTLLVDDRGATPRESFAGLGQGVLGLLQRLVEQGPGTARVGVQPALGCGDVHAQPDQALLGPVVQVALEPTPGVGLGLARRRAALGEGRHPLAQLGRLVDQQGGGDRRVRRDQTTEDGGCGEEEHQPDAGVERDLRDRGGRAEPSALALARQRAAPQPENDPLSPPTTQVTASAKVTTETGKATPNFRRMPPTRDPCHQYL